MSQWAEIIRIARGLPMASAIRAPGAGGVVGLQRDHGAAVAEEDDGHAAGRLHRFKSLWTMARAITVDGAAHTI